MFTQEQVCRMTKGLLDPNKQGWILKKKPSDSISIYQKENIQSFGMEYRIEAKIKASPSEVLGSYLNCQTRSKWDPFISVALEHSEDTLTFTQKLPYFFKPRLFKTKMDSYSVKIKNQKYYFIITYINTKPELENPSDLLNINVENFMQVMILFKPDREQEECNLILTHYQELKGNFPEFLNGKLVRKKLALFIENLKLMIEAERSRE